MPSLGLNLNLARQTKLYRVAQRTWDANAAELQSGDPGVKAAAESRWEAAFAPYNYHAAEVAELLQRLRTTGTLSI